MIQKLRRKFIAANMLLVSVVLFAAMAAQTFSAFQRAREQVYRANLQALEWIQRAEAPNFEFIPNKERPPRPPAGEEGRRPFAGYLPAFAVEIDDKGAVLSVQAGPGASVTQENAQALVDAALSQSGGHGTLPGQELSYLFRQGENGRRFFAFADNSWVGAAVRNQLLASLTVSAAALLAFFFISRFLARISVRPAQEAWERQRQFVADASHELKTPLTVALSNVDMALSVPNFPGEEKNRRRLEIADTELRRMKELVEKLLLLARADAEQTGEGTETCAEVDLSRLVEECISSFEPVFFDAGRRLSGELAPGCAVLGDRDKLKELTDILLDNACKYSGAGSAVLVRLTREDKECHLRVESDGPPIPPEELKHIFERFYRVDRSRGEVRGYGLGLSIAGEIVKRHGGEIWAESGGAGHTVFHVRLQAKPARR